MHFKDILSIGVNHHLLCKTLIRDARSHMETLLPVLEDERFDLFDLWIVGEEPYRTEELKAIRDCGRPIVYNVGDRDGQPTLYPTSRDPRISRYTLDAFQAEIERGLEAGTKKIVTSSGPMAAGDPQDAFKALTEFYCRLCEFVPDDVMVLVEPTDTDFDKRFFLGSSRDAVRLADAVRACGYRNFGSMIDMCHLPPLHETVDEAVRILGGDLRHIHLGTCVTENPRNPFYGDKHPGWGLPDTCWAEREVALLLEAGLASGYFGRDSRGTASFEMVAYDGKPYLDSLDVFFSYMERAFALVSDTYQSGSGRGTR